VDLPACHQQHCSASRVAADAIEQVVVQQLRALVAAGEPQWDRADQPETEAALAQRLVDHVVVGKTRIVIHFDPGSIPSGQPGQLTLPWIPPSPARRREIIMVTGTDDRRATEPMREETRAKLVRAIAQARLWLNELMRNDRITTVAIANRESLSERAVRMRLSLAFLAPDIVEAAIAGRLPQSFGITRLSDLPSDWTEQRRALGIAADAR
jgi:hypothetical protein